MSCCFMNPASPKHDDERGAPSNPNKKSTNLSERYRLGEKWRETRVKRVQGR